MPSITAILSQLGEPADAFAPLPVRSMGDAQLLQTQRSLAEARRRLDSWAATVAGEIAHRSRRELGHGGLAQSHGQRTAEGLISQLTGGSTREARTLVKAGELLPVEAPRADVPPIAPWLAVIGDAVSRATISVAAADAIRSRLGSVGAAGQGSLVDAATRLVADAAGITLERHAERASRVRDELDAAGVAAREAERLERRFLHVTAQPDGMTRIHALLDPESTAIVVPIIDAATSPRRGGPRFVDPDAAQRADDIVRDQRTTEQLALDTFVELIRCGARVDSGRLLGDRKPAVRILVTNRDLERTADAGGQRAGAAYFEAQTEPVSIATAERFICSSGAVPLLFDDDGRAMNLGREQRLFSEKQRIALASRDGGCLMCDRPPAWSEAHHIDHWDEHRGRTDIDDGVLLCRFCHLLVHNRNWRITRTGARYFLKRPDGDGVLRRTALPSRSPALARLLDAG